MVVLPLPQSKVYHGLGKVTTSLGLRKVNKVSIVRAGATMRRR
jgi:hypothetical protein